MIVRVKERWDGEYIMQIDLAAIERSCGVMVVDKLDNRKYVDLSVTQTKRIFKWIRQHVFDEQLDEIEEFMDDSKNKKMVKAWNDTVPKRKK